MPHHDRQASAWGWGDKGSKMGRTPDLSANTPTKMTEPARKQSNQETRGILIGHYSEDLTRARVEAVGLEPQASRSDRTWFMRGQLGLVEVLDRAWRDPMRLGAVYRDAEIHRKGRRARLTRKQFGVEQRAEWDNDHHPRGEPLHYQWDRVKMLLSRPSSTHTSSWCNPRSRGATLRGQSRIA